MSFFQLRRTGRVVLYNGNIKFKPAFIQSIEKGLLYEVIAGAVYGAVGAGILTAFGFSALSIPAVAAWCAVSGALTAMCMNLLPALAMGRWISNPGADVLHLGAVGVAADFGLRVAVVFLGCLTTSFSLETAAVCGLGAVVTEGVVELVRAVDQYVSASPSPIYTI